MMTNTEEIEQLLRREGHLRAGEGLAGLIRRLGVLREGQVVGDLSDSKGFLTPQQMVACRLGEMSVREAAEFLGISRQAVYQAIDRGRLVAREVVRGKRVVSAASVADYVKEK